MPREAPFPDFCPTFPPGFGRGANDFDADAKKARK
jgi:hypothetical protein